MRDFAWLHPLSSLLTGLAYCSILFALVRLVRTRRDLAFSGLFWMLAGFILASGTTHFLDVAALWQPLYRLDGLVKLVTAGLSAATAVTLWRFYPRILTLPIPRQALEAGEGAWRTTFNQAGVGIAHVSAEGRLLLTNDALCRITGYSRAELEATTVQAITHPDDLATDVALAGRVATGEIPAYSLEKRYIRKDGSIVWVYLTVSYHQPDLPGGNPYLIAIVQDITDRKAAEEAVRDSERQLPQFVDGIPQLAWIADRDGWIYWYNRRWYEYTGMTPEQMEGWGWQAVHDPEMLPRVLDRWRRSLETGEPFDMEFPLRGADGVFRTFLTRVLPIRDEEGRVLRWFGTNTDVEEKRRSLAERESLLENERLARGEAERASRLKDEFLATVSHELRTPLNAILGWSQLLRNPGLAEPERLRGVETIARNVRLQAQIIDDLLDMSRIISGKVRLDVRTVDLTEVLEKTLDSMRPAAEAKGVRIETTLDPGAGPVKGDPGRLQQIFWNLFSNAIRFTPRGGRMQVVLERVGSHLEVSVSDTGEGIHPDFLPYVFDRFRQQDGSSTRRHGGLGLGLSIVKNLAELHGGRVRAASAGPGKGATFVVDLPISLAEPAEGPGRAPSQDSSMPGEEHARSLAGLKVQVVDDDLDTREILRRILERCGAGVVMAANAREGLVLFLAERPHVLISDVGMPEEDGYWLIGQVRSLPPDQGGTVPAIALTAFAQAEDRQRALRSGFQAHATKPLEPSDLVTLVASLAGRGRQRDA